MHHLPALLPRQDCISCPDPLPCNCAPNQECFRINRDCNTCARNQCVAKEGVSDNTSSGGVSKGALAGGVIGALIFFAIAISLFIWYRRKTRLRKAFAANREVKQDVPAPAETVLNRPDPTEKPSRPPTELGTVRMYSGSSSTTIDLDPESQNSSTNPHYHSIRSMSTHSNPFDDNHSIQTTGTEGTNVIPIALVSPDQPHHAPSTRSDPSSTSSGPVRPPRTPDMNLNLDHVNVSHDNLRSGTPYALSTISGISGVSSRNSYMTNASFSSDFLNEAPMIMTPSKGAVRQVLGVVKAEVVRAPGTLSSASSSESLKPPSLVGRPSVGSPLASTSFGPADVVKEVDESQEALDPFSDEHSSTGADFGASPPPTAASFGRGRASLHPHDTMRSDLATDGSQLPWARHDDISSRPSSMYTQAGSVIDIGSATRVNVGLGNLSPPAGSNASSRAQFRTTMGRLVTPPTGGSTGTLQEQQQRALAHAQAQAQAQGLDQNRRISGSSVLSAASTRADSILESFPFVPPSPISDRPIRSPPVSPLAQQSFTAASPTSPLGQHKFTVAPPSPLSQQGFNDSHTSVNESADSLPAPPNRRTLGLSTASQFSTASSGLGSFPFQIDSGANSEQPPPSAFNGRHRASLDTLAITSELATYPLGFDRDSVQPPKKS